MKELNTKVGVFLTTYTQREIDSEIEEYMIDNDSDACKLFMSNLRSFNPESPQYITEKEAKKLTGLEKKKGRKNKHNLYTNYKGTPFGITINEATLYYKDPINSLKSAFKAAAPEFDFDNDFFHIKIIK
jgi:hypothetical protein